MLDTPCKLHLTLLTEMERCPACGWCAGDHPTHPTNKRERDEQQLPAAVLRELAELRLVRDCWAYMLSRDPRMCFVIMDRKMVEMTQGTLQLTTLANEYELRFIPRKPLPF